MAKATAPQRHRPVTVMIWKRAARGPAPRACVGSGRPRSGTAKFCQLLFLGRLSELGKCGHRFCRHFQHHRSPDSYERTLRDLQGAGTET